MLGHSENAARGGRKVAAAGALFALAVAAAVMNESGVIGAEKDDNGGFTVLSGGASPTERPELRSSRDPFSAEETAYAIHIATKRGAIPQTATNVNGQPGAEFVNLHLPHDVDGGGRQGVVILYDYTENKSYRQLVDLAVGRVIRSEASLGVQPTATPDEAKAATALAIGHEPTLRFVEQFEEIQGVPLVAPEQLAFRSGTWVHDGVSAAGKSCGADRCMQLILSTPQRVFLNTQEFVVNLSKREVTELVKR